MYMHYIPTYIAESNTDLLERRRNLIRKKLADSPHFSVSDYYVTAMYKILLKCYLLDMENRIDLLLAEFAIATCYISFEFHTIEFLLKTFYNQARIQYCC